MIIDSYAPDALHAVFGIDMSTIDLPGVASVGAGWGRVRPGERSDPHQHDEVEVFVIVAGTGAVVVDGVSRPVGPGTVVLFEAFETHVLANTGDVDVLFTTFYWRDVDHASAKAATAPARRGFGQRPVFVFATPPTPNGDLHLGHLSGPYLGADCFVRFQRMNGVAAWYLTGSDDYQSYVAGRARAEGTTPADTAARYSARIADTLARLDIQVDQYTVTDQEAGYRDGLRDHFSRLVASGAVRPTAAPALLDADGRYRYEGDVTGGCPDCGASCGGNICEECGAPNLCVDLTDPSVADAVRAPVTRFSLPLHEFRDTVGSHHHLGRVPARLRELAERVFARGEFELPVSHPADWGVPPAESGVDGDQVIWVWPEMAYGFLYGVQSLGERLGERWRADEPTPDWKIVHFFGYDNSFYHGVLYPVLYRLAFPEWEPDIDYHVNEFYLLDGEKFSTSRRHAVWGRDLVDEHGPDAVRYYLAATRPEGRRTNFGRAAFDACVRDVLDGTWQRWLTGLGTRIAERHDGRAPDAGTWFPEHTAFLAQLENRRRALTDALGQDGFSLNRAAAELTGIVTDATAFAAREERAAGIARWHDHARTAIALELAAARLLARCAAPVLPRFAARLAAALGDPPPTTWPHAVDRVPADTPIGLAGVRFFGPVPEDPAPNDTAPNDTVPEDTEDAGAWLAASVRTTLGLPDDVTLADRHLADLNLSSLQLVTLQYSILRRFDVDIPVADLLTGTVADIAHALTEPSGRATEEVTV